eukprot:TRINITY_DN16798_c0_g1_i1.p1 TRINITY_DN16798_c0_g1~~TRINITY_DN16798_c0_g1_i1.p1  ORF type:complete len:62 (-),score=7.06 TRINITY_DN16798_c0_g1_i1:313-498(-)
MDQHRCSKCSQLFEPTKPSEIMCQQCQIAVKKVQALLSGDWTAFSGKPDKICEGLFVGEYD